MFRMLVAALAAFSFATPAIGGLLDDMAALDRAYVPALALTNQPKVDPARRAIERLRSEWNRFRTAYPDAPTGYDAGAWAKANTEIEAAIGAAEANIASGRGPAAHDDLEHIRDVQLVVRRGAKQPYFLDDLTVFHTAMEKLAAPATGKSGATIGEGDIAAITAAFPQAEQSWQMVVANRVLAAKLGIAPDVEVQVQRDIDGESQLLAELKAALAAGDRAKIAEKAQLTKPAFSRLFQRFGDFGGLR